MGFTTYTVVREFGNWQSLFEADNALLACARVLAEKNRAVGGLIEQLVVQKSNNKMVAGTNEVRSQLEKTADFLREVPLNEIIVEGHELQDAVRNLKGDAELLPVSTIEPFLSDIEEFLEIHQSFRRDYNHKDTLRLLLLSDRINRQRNIIAALSGSLVGKLSHIEVPEGYEKLEVHFSANIDFPRLSAKIHAIQEIYTRLCLITHVRESEFPLRVSRLESASFMVTMLGKLGLMKLFELLIERFAEDLLLEHTRRGRVERLQAEVDLVSAYAELSDTLQEQGVSRPVDGERLERASEALSEQFASLFEGEVSVEVGGRRIEAPGEGRAIEQAQTPRLLSPGVGEAREYRRRSESDVWHWCRNCSNWPETGFEAEFGEPESGRLDSECSAKTRNSQCAG